MEYILNTYPAYVVCIFICLAKILEISIQSLKTVFMVKGRKGIAATLGFCECVIWGLVISSIITLLSGRLELLFSYCLGYALGLYIGSIIEGKIALGTNSVQFIFKKEYLSAVEESFLEHTQGYTVLEGRGAHDEMCVVLVVLPRKVLPTVIKRVQKICENHVFINSYDVTKFVGGYGIKK